MIFIEVNIYNYNDLQSIHDWPEQRLVIFSEPKTKSLVISNKHDKGLNPPVVMNNE